MAKQKINQDNPLTGKSLPPPPPMTTFSAPDATITPVQTQSVLDTTQESAAIKKDEIKLTVVLCQEQEDMLSSLKIEYQRRFRKWLSDTELVRRLIEQATIDDVLTPSMQVRTKQEKKS